MSYDVAVSEGERPASDAQPRQTLRERFHRAGAPPSPRILAYIAALTARYPDLTELPDDDLDASPWGDGPLTNNASV